MLQDIDYIAKKTVRSEGGATQQSELNLQRLYCLTRTMIRMVMINTHGTIKLFDQHDANQWVREGEF